MHITKIRNHKITMWMLSIYEMLICLLYKWAVMTVTAIPMPSLRLMLQTSALYVMPHQTMNYKYKIGHIYI